MSESRVFKSILVLARGDFDITVSYLIYSSQIHWPENYKTKICYKLTWFAQDDSNIQGFGMHCIFFSLK